MIKIRGERITRPPGFSLPPLKKTQINSELYTFIVHYNFADIQLMINFADTFTVITYGKFVEKLQTIYRRINQ